mmetsp:Transcript_2915/g.8132  ORF Transcript_2915/g.8132 Transcript_2915/m.8132 type:complete len:233 (-) Transcript_2915:376-1074(-)
MCTRPVREPVSSNKSIVSSPVLATAKPPRLRLHRWCRSLKRASCMTREHSHAPGPGRLNAIMQFGMHASNSSRCQHAPARPLFTTGGAPSGGMTRCIGSTRRSAVGFPQPLRCSSTSHKNPSAVPSKYPPVMTWRVVCGDCAGIEPSRRRWRTRIARTHTADAIMSTAAKTNAKAYPPRVYRSERVDPTRNSSRQGPKSSVPPMPPSVPAACHMPITFPDSLYVGTMSIISA